jgi:hypothetical protein
LPAYAVLKYRAVPMIADRPTELSHKRGLGSKWRLTVNSHQIK